MADDTGPDAPADDPADDRPTTEQQASGSQDEPGNAAQREPGTEAARPSATRRPGTTAAASAASRARRIGGARSTSRPGGADDAGSAAAAKAPAPTPADDDAGAAAAVSVTKAGRPARSGKLAARASTDSDTSAKALAGDRTDVGGPVVVTQAPSWLKWVPALVLAVCAVVMAVLVAVSAHGVWYAKPSSSALRDKVLAAAKTCTAAANTYSYRTIPQDEAKGLACSTGKWTGEYRKAFATLVKPIATKLKASQAIQINTAGIENIASSGRQWTVVVFGQTKVTQAGKKNQVDPFSAEITMQHVGGKWLIAQIATIAKPTG